MLAIGNVLNESSAQREAADGFALESALPKLAETRAADGATTLLDAVVAYVRRLWLSRCFHRLSGRNNTAPVTQRAAGVTNMHLCVACQVRRGPRRGGPHLGPARRGEGTRKPPKG